MTVKVIIPYLGKSYPSYLPIFLKTAGFQSQFQFIFISNLRLPDDCPPNVKHHHISTEELVRLAKEKLEITLDLTFPYKLCDLKPAYGLLFEELLSDADWWGFSDIDLLLGDLSLAIQEGLFTNYDIISFRKFWLSGSLAFFRNNKVNKTLFQSSPDWKRVFEDRHFVGFDEACRLPRKGDNVLDHLRKGVSLKELSTTYHSFSEVLFFEEHQQRMHFEDRIKEYIAEDELIRFEGGNVFAERGNEDLGPFISYHWVTEKASYKFSYPDWKEVPSKFWVSQYGFHLHQDSIENEIEDRKRNVRRPKTPERIIKRLLEAVRRRWP